MIKKPNIALTNVFSGSPPWEIRLINLLYYSNLVFLIIAFLALILDSFNVFNISYLPFEVSVIGFSLLVIYFLRKGSKNVAVNLINFLPIPIYFLLVSSDTAIFPPPDTIFFHVLILSLGFLFLFLFANSIVQILVFLAISSASLLYHIYLAGLIQNLSRFFWPSQELIVNPLLANLSLGSITILLYILFHEELRRQDKISSERRANLRSVISHHPMGIIQISINRDDFGEKSGMTIDYINPSFERFFDLRNSEVRGVDVSVIFLKIFRNEVNWQELFQNNGKIQHEILHPSYGSMV